METATQDILLYQSPDGQIRLDVQLDHDTVWLTQAQMSELFSISKKTVSEHINNVFREKGLSAAVVVRDSRTTATDGKSYRTKFYNLDVIISVGYRVKSARGTNFRQWATQVLRQYLVQGYVLNEKRLRENARQLADLKRLVQLQAKIASNQELTADQSDTLLRILGDYARALDVLDQYDHQRLHVARDTVATPANELFELTPENARQAIKALRVQFGAPNYLAAKKTSRLKARYARFTRVLAGRICIRAWKRRPPICCIS